MAHETPPWKLSENLGPFQTVQPQLVFVRFFNESLNDSLTEIHVGAPLASWEILEVKASIGRDSDGMFQRLSQHRPERFNGKSFVIADSGSSRWRYLDACHCLVTCFCPPHSGSCRNTSDSKSDFSLRLSCPHSEDSKMRGGCRCRHCQIIVNMINKIACGGPFLLVAGFQFHVAHLTIWVCVVLLIQCWFTNCFGSSLFSDWCILSGLIHITSLTMRNLSLYDMWCMSSFCVSIVIVGCSLSFRECDDLIMILEVCSRMTGLIGLVTREIYAHLRQCWVPGGITEPPTIFLGKPPRLCYQGSTEWMDRSRCGPYKGLGGFLM